MGINPILVMPEGNNNGLKIKAVAKYYINGKGISKEEAKERGTSKG